MEYNDPFFPEVGRGRHYHLHALDSALKISAGSTVVLILTDHSLCNYGEIVRPGAAGRRFQECDAVDRIPQDRALLKSAQGEACVTNPDGKMRVFLSPSETHILSSLVFCVDSSRCQPCSIRKQVSALSDLVSHGVTKSPHNSTCACAEPGKISCTCGSYRGDFVLCCAVSSSGDSQTSPQDV